MACFRSGTQFRKDVAELMPRISFGGEPCLQADAALFAEALVLREALILDLFGDERSAIGYRRALRSLRTIDAKAVFQVLKSLYRDLVNEDFLEEGNWAIFKQSLSAYPTWIVAPLQRHLPDGEVTVSAFTKALQWIRFDAKLSFQGTSSYDDVVEYLDDEFVMNFIDQPDEHVLHALNQILVEWCQRFDSDRLPFTGRHSSGAVTGLSRRSATPRKKFRLSVMSPEGERYLHLREDVDGWPLNRTVAEPHSTGWHHEEYRPPKGEPVCQVMFVPKDPLRRRVVSPEDSFNMFLQGDAADVIYDFMEKFHWCHRRDQSVSQEMCLRGSIDGRYTTVDASKASDFVTLSIVRSITQDTPLQNFLLLTRTRYALVPEPDPRSKSVSGDGVNDFLFNGKPVITYLRIRLEKFAPMGSRVCFPTETLVFALCAELAVRITLGRKSRVGDFVVYGDDVVIRTDCYAAYRFIVSLLRFRTNDDKSFSGTGKLIFREACGMFALNGVDVTPVLISRKYRGAYNVFVREERKPCSPMKRDMPSAAASLGVFDFANRLLLHGLNVTRRWVMSVFLTESWASMIWRVNLSDFLQDQEWYKCGLPADHQYPVPTLLTPDHVDANFQLEIKAPKWRGKKVSGPLSSQIVTTKTCSDGVKDLNWVDYLHWTCVRSVTGEEWRGEGEIPFVERLTYSSPGNVTWRQSRLGRS